MSCFKVQSWNLPRETRKNVGSFVVLVKNSNSVLPEYN